MYSLQKTDRMSRKTVMRYVTLCYVLVFRDISERIRRRFPTYNHLVPSLLTEAEKSRIEKEDIKRVYWMPIEWATQLLKKCYRRGQIDEYHFGVLCDTMLKYREMMHNLLSYDWVNVPLVYTQVVHICTVAYFGITCIANQPIKEPGARVWINEFVVPVYNVYEFIFFVGWLKVAQVMLNPFGLDEDDFEIDMLIERNLQVGYSYVESLYERLPPLILVDVALLFPHTKASMALIKQANPMIGSVANVNVPRDEQQVISKDDVEMIRKLLGPKFGRRFDYVRKEPSDDVIGSKGLASKPYSQSEKESDLQETQPLVKGTSKARSVSDTSVEQLKTAKAPSLPQPTQPKQDEKKGPPKQSLEKSARGPKRLQFEKG
ncbi:Bestrophin [Cooperia oncophora]